MYILNLYKGLVGKENLSFADSCLCWGDKLPRFKPCLLRLPGVCLWTKYRTSLSVVFYPESGNNNSIHLLKLLWELWKTMCVKCLTWCLACPKHSTDRNTTKEKEGKKEMGLWSQSSLVLNPGSATPWQLFQVILDVTVGTERESAWRLLDGCLTQSQCPMPGACYLGP